MCGIAGIFSYQDSAPPIDSDELLRIRDAMAMRGPDGAGVWVSDGRRIALAHRRLAIIDLSDRGAQPMASADGRLRVTFNGEIYNYRELRAELEGRGCRFQSGSDTEVLLHMYAERGRDMVHALQGMFAFAIWDERDRTLFLARDPFGIKPLYVADDGRCVRFASQVKALLKGGRVDTAPEPAGSVGFLIWGCVPEPFTLYRGVRSLPAGGTLLVSQSGRQVSSRYFDLSDELRRAEDAGAPAASNARDILREAATASVRRHLVADVPVGIFLSAGIDSSTVAGLAARAGESPLHAVTLGFSEFQGTANDEVPIASEVARNLGIRHDVHRISRDDFQAELARILEVMDQPSTDGVNTYFVSRAAARSGLKVALSGVGGDELFGGYPSFAQVPRMATRLRLAGTQSFAGRAARLISAPFLKRIASPKYAGLLEYGGSYAGAYLLRRALFMPWEVDSLLDPSTVHAGLEELRTLRHLQATIDGVRRPRSKVAALELAWYMRNQLLRDADWAGMAHSLEIRVPLVDVQFFRAIAPLVASDRYPTKHDLADVLETPVPEIVRRRPKSGFMTPVKEWIGSAGRARGPEARGLRAWALHVLPPQPRTIRTLALVTDAFGGCGGIAKFNRDLAAALAAMPECAEVVMVSRLMTSEPGPIPPRVTFLTKAVNSKTRFVVTALTEALKGNVDLLVVGHINLSPLGIVLARLKRVPSILFLHGIDAWTAHRNPLVRASLARFTSVVTVSEVTAERFGRWSGVEAAKMRLLPNCVDLARYGTGPKSTELAKRLGLQGRTVLMTLGRLESEERAKGFDEIIDVLPALAMKIPDVSYLICGNGNDRARLEEKVARLGLRDRVVFAGFTPEEEKAEYYRLADAYVMPSRGEGFGIVFLEALACGIPVMGSRTDGGREALLDGTLGCLVDPADPSDIERGVLETLRRKSGFVPRELSVYSHEMFSARTLSLVREMLAAPRSGPPTRSSSSLGVAVPAAASPSTKSH